MLWELGQTSWSRTIIRIQTDVIIILNQSIALLLFNRFYVVGIQFILWWIILWKLNNRTHPNWTTTVNEWIRLKSVIYTGNLHPAVKFFKLMRWNDVFQNTAVINQLKVVETLTSSLLGLYKEAYIINYCLDPRYEQYGNHNTYHT